MTLRAPAILAIASTVLAGCTHRSSPRPLSDDEKVVHLANGAPLEYRTANDATRPNVDIDLTRPSVEIRSGAAAAWPIAAGPERVVRTDYVSSSSGKGRLRASIHPAAGAEVELSQSEIGGSGAWKGWKFTIPALEQAGTLEIEFRGEGPPASIVLAQPTLSRPAKASPRIFILFDVDTLRTDHVSLYGYGRPTTPRIDRYFRTGSIWRNVFSNVPWTLPAHVTMFTSTLPGDHGVGERRDTIPPELPTLASVLTASGYRTLGVTNGYFVDSSWGFARGFDEYQDLGLDRDVMAEIDRLLLLLTRYRGEPIFAFFHTYALHDYISPLEPARALLGDFARLGPLPHRMPFLIPRSTYGSYREEDVRQWMVNRYDAALRNVDDAFGRLLEGLASQGVLDDSTILLTSDHGEELFDRPADDPYARIGHIQPFLYDEYLRVPFLLRGPRKFPRPVADDPASLVDMAPTVLDALAVAPPRAFRGRSLLKHDAARAPEPILVSGPGMEAVAVRDGRFKMIRRTRGPVVAWDTGARFERLASSECFDVESDPQEKRPIPCASAGFAAMRQRVEGLVAERFPGSFVFRISETAAAKVLGLSSRSDTGSPSISSFGIPDLRVEKSGDATRLGITAGDEPVWVGVKAGAGSQALEVDLFGPLSASYFPSSGSTEVSAPWRDLQRHPPSAWKTNTFFTTAGDEYRRDPPAIAGSESLARLRSIGYVGSGGALSPLRSEAHAESGAGELPRTVVIRAHPELPAWVNAPPRGPRSIRALIPESAAVGAPFRAGTDGTSELQLVGSGFTPGDRIFLDTLRIATIYLDDANLLGRIPAYFLGRPATLSLTVRDVTNPAVPELASPFVVSPAR